MNGDYNSDGRVLDCGSKRHGFKPRYSPKKIVCDESLYRLEVRTLPFHGKNTGSNPVRDSCDIMGRKGD